MRLMLIQVNSEEKRRFEMLDLLPVCVCVFMCLCVRWLRFEWMCLSLMLVSGCVPMCVCVCVSYNSNEAVWEIITVGRLQTSRLKEHKGRADTVCWLCVQLCACLCVSVDEDTYVLISTWMQFNIWGRDKGWDIKTGNQLAFDKRKAGFKYKLIIGINAHNDYFIRHTVVFTK